MRAVGYVVLAVGVAVMVWSYSVDRAITAGFGLFTVGLLLMAIGRSPKARARDREQRSQRARDRRDRQR